MTLLDIFTKTDNQDLQEIVVVDNDPLQNDPKKPTAEDILRDNIAKANKFLDLALASVDNGTITSLWIERVASLINAITLAAEKIIGAGTEFMDLEIKRDLVTLKSRELELKSIPGSGIKSLTQNVFQMTSEDALELLRKSRESEGPKE
jgi:hypothetical protein